MANDATRTDGAARPDYIGLTVADYEDAIDDLFYRRGEEWMFHLIRDRALLLARQRLERKTRSLPNASTIAPKQPD